MDFTVTSSADSNEVRLSGTLTFSDHSKSKELEKIIRDNSAASVRIDMSGLEFIDSMGLGMLMLWKHTAQETRTKIEFGSPSDKVAMILKAGKMDEFLSTT